MTPEQRLCNLMFDEIALTPVLYYNRSIDQIIDFEKNTVKIADHCLVFMIKGIKSKYKQPICYQFCQSATKSHILKALIIDIIRRLRECGLIIVATICDQGTSNVSAINSLIKDTKEKYLRHNKVYKSSVIEIDDTPLFHIYDPPHLLKGLRNNWINKNIRFIFNGEVMMAKWEHLKMLMR
ncbi:unnamed protein product [Parnassius mnemosyne]|uniref:Transposable element P transposase-like RNase H domain-containing protein n=1 Tax=Parnassius mnemosyne TaxID=213953 RepID=A0AAV1L852_9NEOP